MRVHVLHRVLIKDCEKGMARDRREVLSANTELEMEKLLYRRMLTTISECRRRKRATTSRPATTAVTTGPTSTVKAASKSKQKTVTTVNMTKTSTKSTPKATITDNMTPKSIKSTQKTTSTPMTTSIPSECISAINLTESWRRDYKGSDITPVNGRLNCDTSHMINKGRPWFRFSGAAGNRLLDSCRSMPTRSCGTHLGMWSNAAMPIATAEAREINAYAGYSGSCKYFTYKLEVMKCSERQYDYIYKYLGDDHCHLGFCGMV